MNGLGIGYYARRCEGREPLAYVQGCLSKRVPLFATAVEAVDIEHDGLAEDAGKPGERAVRHVAEQNNIVTAQCNVGHGNQAALPGIKMFLMNAWKNYAPHSLFVNVVRSSNRLAAIDRNLVPAIGELRTDLFGELFETTVAIGNAASADDRNFQGRSSMGGEDIPAGMGEGLTSANRARGVSLNHQINR